MRNYEQSVSQVVACQHANWRESALVGAAGYGLGILMHRFAKLFQQANRADGIVVSILASQTPLESARDPGSNPGRRTSFFAFSSRILDIASSINQLEEAPFFLSRCL